MRSPFIVALLAFLSLLGCDASGDSDTVYHVLGRGVAPGDTLDLDGDGTADLTFRHPLPTCTADVPTSACGEVFEVEPLAGRAILYRTSPSRIALGPGDEVGPRPDLGSGVTEAWSRFAAKLISVLYNYQRETREVRSAPWTDPGGAYIGVRLGDGNAARYGWIRLTASVDVEEEPRPQFSAMVHEVAFGAKGEAVTVGEQP